jgi:hypothetical protein
LATDRKEIKERKKNRDIYGQRLGDCWLLHDQTG